MAGIYIHIPFCLRKCAYCDFVSFPGTDRAEEYVNALLREIELRGEGIPPRTYDTLFIGGGTPSALDAEYITKIMGRLYACLDVDFKEATIECNPGTVNKEKLKAYRDCGFDRISIGAQSFSDGLLWKIGRIHDSGQIAEAVQLARSAGFDNINLDLMYGLPGQGAEDHIESIVRAEELGVEHISAYSLILEEGTPLFDRVENGMVTMPDDDRVYDIHRAGMDKMRRLGYRRYEVSNYCRPGYECRHNLNYWDCGEYIGLGLNASSAMEMEGWKRWRNTPDLDDYISLLDKYVLPVEEQDIIPEKDHMFEWMMLGLRKINGVDRRAFKEKFRRDPAEVYGKILDRLAGDGLVVLDKDRMFLTDRGMDIQNSVLLELMQ